MFFLIFEPQTGRNIFLFGFEAQQSKNFVFINSVVFVYGSTHLGVNHDMSCEGEELV